jgi:hypothetical protein
MLIEAQARDHPRRKNRAAVSDNSTKRDSTSNGCQ